MNIGDVIGFSLLFGFLAIMIGVAVYAVCEMIALETEKQNIIKTLFTKVFHRNLLYQCNESGCKRYFRRFQWDLHKGGKTSSIGRCPHCGEVTQGSSYCSSKDLNRVTRIAKPDKWMDSHPDCFRISFIDYFMLGRKTKKILKLKEEEAAIKRFEDYNKLKVDMNWIENLHKRSE